MWNRLRKSTWAALFAVYLRYLIGGAFVFASLVKLGGERFTGRDGSANPIHSLEHFFETLYQSGLYWQFLGLAQLLAGLVLMTQRFAALGAALFFPVILNVFVITLSYDFRGTPLITGLMLLANLFLLLWDFDKFRPLFGLAPVPARENGVEKNPVWSYTGLALFTVTLLLGITEDGRNRMLFPWLLLCMLIGLAALLRFRYTNRIRSA